MKAIFNPETFTTVASAAVTLLLVAVATVSMTHAFAVATLPV